MSVVVTGGAGFLGSHLVDRLISRGQHVVVIDNLLTGKLGNLSRALSGGKATFVHADVNMTRESFDELLAASCEGRLEAIYHLASPASPEAYGAHPWETLLVNGVATTMLIEVALSHDALLFFASTSEVYGDPLVHPQPESYFGNVNSIGPRACYDEGKRFAEAAISVAIKSRGLKGRIMRVFNCYGPRMAMGDGRVIPAFLEALQENKPMPIHGTGLQTRSMSYVDDLVDGIEMVAKHPVSEAFPVNLGGEDERTVIDIGKALCAVAKQEFEPAFLPGRPEDPQRRRPDTTRARSLGWQAKTSIEEGLTRTWTWFTQECIQYV